MHSSHPTKLAALLGVAAIVVAACAGGASNAPTSGTSVTPSAPAVVASIPPDQLIKAGTLTICSDTSYPPQESLDATTQKPIGSDIDLATEIAARLGLTLEVKPTDFNGIIPALQGATCDIIVSAQTITAERQKTVDMIPYFEAGQAFVVLTGNPDNIKTVLDVCGKQIAAETGTVEADNLTGAGDYKGAGIAKTCTDAGKAVPTLKSFTADTDALLALTAHTVSAHFTDEPVAGYEVKNGNGAYELSPVLLEHAPEGISVLKTKTAIKDAVTTALKSMMTDGTYLQILTKWGVQSGKLSTPLQ